MPLYITQNETELTGEAVFDTLVEGLSTIMDPLGFTKNWLPEFWMKPTIQALVTQPPNWLKIEVTTRRASAIDPNMMIICAYVSWSYSGIDNCDNERHWDGSERKCETELYELPEPESVDYPTFHPFTITVGVYEEEGEQSGGDPPDEDPFEEDEDTTVRHNESAYCVFWECSESMLTTLGLERGDRLPGGLSWSCFWPDLERRLKNDPIFNTVMRINSWTMSYETGGANLVVTEYTYLIKMLALAEGVSIKDFLPCVTGDITEY
jgi:hypothetical protein